ncbi:MAG: acyl carrier protein [Syntrophobacteraceae bacterium]
MTQEQIHARLLQVFSDRFEIVNPGLDEDLREVYEFDSIDAIELLREIELMLGTPLSLKQKKEAMHIRTIRQIIEYLLVLSKPQASR